MLFSEPTFLFFFLPAVLLLYFGLPRRFQDVVLLAFSLLFYLWGERGFRKMPAPSMGAEDFSYILQRLPGCMAFLGVAPEGVSKRRGRGGTGRGTPYHSV